MPATICEIITKANNVYAFTFHSVYILIHCHPLCNLLLLLLYIPFWLYSNDCNDAEINRANTFTFQSGYIQIPSWQYSFWRSANFTFQSGYIQMRIHESEANVVGYFTFQSGYIQILQQPQPILSNLPLHSNLVIFKSALEEMPKGDRLPLHSNLVIFK